MPRISQVKDEDLRRVKEELEAKHGKVRAWQIKERLKTELNIDLDESTIRGKFIEMGCPLSGAIGTPIRQVKTPQVKTQPIVLPTVTNTEYPNELQSFIPQPVEFQGYVTRDVDKRLAIQYNTSRPGHWKYPLSQGKQGTGKTYSHRYYAYLNKMPFLLYSMYEDFRLPKLFGDKTIQNGSIVFRESLFVTAIQYPCVILFDEINALSNANTFDFHALLQNRELFVKDADDGNGKVFKLHDGCKIGFAQNPRSAKYIGGNIKASNFLGRCTYLTYPEFTKKEVSKALNEKYSLSAKEIEQFITFYFACIDAIDKANIPVDISIRQLNNVIDLWKNGGLELRFAVEDGMTSILEAISQPKAKDGFYRLMQAVWEEFAKEGDQEKVGDVDEQKNV
jgi:hypothetical protein